MSRLVLVLVVVLAPAPARAEYPVIPPEPIVHDACSYAVLDPVVTPVRDVGLDAQRSACLRSELSAGLLGHALIDTPGFHGVLGGDLSIAGRAKLGYHLELSVQATVVEYDYVQNAVNKATHTGFGPLVLGAAYGDRIASDAYAALVAQLELPNSAKSADTVPTLEEMDTLRTSGSLSAVLTGQLAARFVLHARLGAYAMYRESTAGSASWLGLRAGSDVAWHLRPRLGLAAGADLSAGWTGGLDNLLLRAGVHWQVTRARDWRLRAGVGVPVAGNDRTNAVLDVTVVHGI